MTWEKMDNSQSSVRTSSITTAIPTTYRDIETKLLGTSGDKWAMERAMENVRKNYSVVGVIEDFHKTLRVLEEEIPLFFGGVADLYFNVLHGKT